MDNELKPDAFDNIDKEVFKNGYIQRLENILYELRDIGDRLKNTRHSDIRVQLLSQELALRGLLGELTNENASKQGTEDK